MQCHFICSRPTPASFYDDCVTLGRLLKCHSWCQWWGEVSVGGKVLWFSIYWIYLWLDNFLCCKMQTCKSCSELCLKSWREHIRLTVRKLAIVLPHADVVCFLKLYQRNSSVVFCCFALPIMSVFHYRKRANLVVGILWIWVSSPMTLVHAWRSKWCSASRKVAMLIGISVCRSALPLAIENRD